MDLAGVLMGFSEKKGWKGKGVKTYVRFSMANAPKKLKIPHGTRLDENHIVLGKIPNVFLARTESYRALGYDDNIRRIDHHEFFFRAAGHLVAALDTECFIAHGHCPFDHTYQQIRYNIAEDKRYIAAKHAGYFSTRK